MNQRNSCHSALYKDTRTYFNRSTLHVGEGRGMSFFKEDLNE